MFEVWICGKWDGADWDLAYHTSSETLAHIVADSWRKSDFVVEVRSA